MESAKCCAHSKRADILTEIKQILKERKAQPVQDKEKINVNIGSRVEQMALRDLQALFKTTEEWEKIQTFYCQTPDLVRRTRS